MSRITLCIVLVLCVFSSAFAAGGGPSPQDTIKITPASNGWIITSTIIDPSPNIQGSSVTFQANATYSVSAGFPEYDPATAEQYAVQSEPLTVTISPRTYRKDWLSTTVIPTGWSVQFVGGAGGVEITPGGYLHFWTVATNDGHQYTSAFRLIWGLK